MNNFGDFNLLVPVIALSLPCIVLGFCIGFLVFRNNGDEIMKQQAIENQCARYNPNNGEFEWIKK